MHKKTSFLRDFQKNRLFACVFCAFFASSALASLPAGFTELEYIESTGTQWIDTRITVLDNDEIKLKACTTDASSTFIFSQGLSANNQAYQLANASTNKIVFDIQNYTPYRVTSDLSAYNTLREFHIKNKEFFVDGVSQGVSTGNLTSSTETLKLFYSASGSHAQKAKICYFNVANKINLIPARRYSDNVVGMYDIANSGKNVFDISKITNGYMLASSTGVITSNNNYAVSEKIYLPAGTYTFSQDRNNSSTGDTFRIWAYNSSDVALTKLVEAKAEECSLQTFTMPNNANYIRLSYRQATSTNVQLESGTYATSYEPYPFYTNSGTGTFIAGPEKSITDIQIATTKFVDDEFKAAEDQLATTVQTIESIVSRTITQTGQIQVLQDTKQTRPDETCPANMKCLLVQDEDGTPHWYPIIEP